MRWGLIALCACGRVGFDPPTTNDDAPGSDAAFVCPPFALLCDDFEVGNLGKWTDRVVSPNSEIGVDAMHAHGGVQSMYATVDMQTGNGASEMVTLDSSALTTGTLAVRGWFRSPRALTNFEGTIVLTENAQFDNRYVEVTCSDQGDVWAITEFPGLADHSGTRACAADTWQCLEIDYSYGASVQLYVDDEKVVDFVPTDIANPGYLLVGVGIARATTDPLQVFTDDVVVADRHIGCN